MAGVFETTLVVDGGALALDRHLARLEVSVWELYRQPAPADARGLVEEAAGGTALGRLRLTVAPGAGGKLAAEASVAPVDEREVFPAWDLAVELAPTVVPGGVGAHKWADRRLLERAEADLAPALPLIVDDDGSALEASRGNLFVAIGGTLVTPAADGRLLPGITRQRAIETAQALGFAVREQALDLEALAGADEAFLTGAVRGVEPVRACAGVAAWGEGPFTALVAAALRLVWDGLGRPD
jgi:para-aminobenzoate synthetase / 4-amino-4-deoxychorismate lyase